MMFYKEVNGCIILNVKVIPRASQDEVQGIIGDALKIRIQAPPVEGKANAYLVRFLSKQWNISRASIKILSGETGRNKRIRILNPTGELFTALRSMEDEIR